MRSMLMRPLLCLSALIAAACSVETKPIAVLRVIDGNTIEVGADLGGVQVPVRVRLLYVEAPELHDKARGPAMPEAEKARKALDDWFSLNLEGLAQIVDANREQAKRVGFTLWFPEDGLTRDANGIVQAVALQRYVIPRIVLEGPPGRKLAVDRSEVRILNAQD